MSRFHYWLDFERRLAAVEVPAREVHTAIIADHTPVRPPPLPPPIIGREGDSFRDNDEDSFAA